MTDHNELAQRIERAEGPDRARCETCRWGDELPAWRKQARNALPGKVIECSFAAIAVLKLPTDRCASHQPKGPEA